MAMKFHGNGLGEAWLNFRALCASKQPRFHVWCHQIVTLPALQKMFVDFFFELAWGFCIENGGDFW